MKKLLLIVVLLFLAILIFAGITFFLNRNSGKGALQVTSLPKSNVYLDGKLIGQTPLCKCEAKILIKTGAYTIKLAPLEGGFTPFENKIIITAQALTVIDRTFGQGASSEGSIISFSQIPDKKDRQISVISFPDKTKVFLDSALVGLSPILVKGVTESDHDLKLAKDGYKQKSIRIRTAKGFKLEALVTLAVEENIASPSPAIATPSPKPAPKIVILNTPTGFLRVREDSSLNSNEIGRVMPGETYELLDEKEGWFKIKLSSPAGEEKTGWVSSQYANKQ